MVGTAILEVGRWVSGSIPAIKVCKRPGVQDVPSTGTGQYLSVQ